MAQHGRVFLFGVYQTANGGMDFSTLPFSQIPWKNTALLQIFTIQLSSCSAAAAAACS